jgi:AcrR family transcriptional regulator
MSPNKSTRRPVVNPEPIARIGQAERTRAAILDAAFEFLWSRPFRDMTVNALMEQIPQGRTAFYKYFDDIHGVMAALLKNLESEILEGIKAVSDAAGTNAELEDEWNWLLDRFDEAVSERITADQELGLIEAFDPRPVATALNRVDAAMYIRKFGHRPRSRPQPVQDAITRVWISTLYGQQWATGQVPDPPEPR